MVPARVVWSALAAERLALRARELTARRHRPMRVVEVALRSPRGWPLPARLHLPEGTGPFPAVLFCPGGLDGARGAEGLSTVVTAPRLARAGVAALAWSPSGREGAPGEEDRNGALHQEECAAALRALLARPEVHRAAVLSISFGVVLAAYALTRWPELAGHVRGLVDWEGPPSRRWFQASRLPLSGLDDAWWAWREAATRVGALRCPYVRVQSAWDHVHGADTTLGDEMADAALAGDCPEVRFNHHDARRPRERLAPSLARQGDALLRIVRERLG